MKRKFNRAFAPNRSPKHDLSPALDIANEVCYVSDQPIYDAAMDDKAKQAVEIGKALSSFDPDKDVVLDSGDPVVLAMIICYVSNISADFWFARYNSRAGRYVVTNIDIGEIDESLVGIDLFDLVEDND